jgi:hypothetical protein
VVIGLFGWYDIKLQNQFFPFFFLEALIFAFASKYLINLIGDSFQKKVPLTFVQLCLQLSQSYLRLRERELSLALPSSTVPPLNVGYVQLKEIASKCCENLLRRKMYRAALSLSSSFGLQESSLRIFHSLARVCFLVDVRLSRFYNDHFDLTNFDEYSSLFPTSAETSDREDDDSQDILFVLGLDLEIPRFGNVRDDIWGHLRDLLTLHDGPHTNYTNSLSVLDALLSIDRMYVPPLWLVHTLEMGNPDGLLGIYLSYSLVEEGVDLGCRMIQKGMDGIRRAEGMMGGMPHTPATSEFGAFLVYLPWNLLRALYIIVHNFAGEGELEYESEDAEILRERAQSSLDLLHHNIEEYTLLAERTQARLLDLLPDLEEERKKQVGKFINHFGMEDATSLIPGKSGKRAGKRERSYRE